MLNYSTSIALPRPAPDPLRMRPAPVVNPAPDATNPAPDSPSTSSSGSSSSPNAPDARPSLVWRTRDSQTSRLYNLQLDINDVKLEIARLQAQRDTLYARTLVGDDSLGEVSTRVFLAFFEAFRLHPDHPGAKDAFRRTLANEVAVSHATGLKPAVQYIGRQELMTRWRSQRDCFEDMQFDLEKLQVDVATETRVVLDGRARVEATITTETLRRLFPQIVGDMEIARKLVGKRLQSIAQISAVVAKTPHRIVAFDVTVDMASVFTATLQSPREIMLLFGQGQEEQQ